MAAENEFIFIKLGFHPFLSKHFVSNVKKIYIILHKHPYNFRYLQHKKDRIRDKISKSKNSHIANFLPDNWLPFAFTSSTQQKWGI